jgi:hypothetical protein
MTTRIQQIATSNIRCQGTMEPSKLSADGAATSRVFSDGNQSQAGSLKLNKTQNDSPSKPLEVPKPRSRRRYNYSDFYYNATPKMNFICNSRIEQNVPVVTELTKGSLAQNDREKKDHIVGSVSLGNSHHHDTEEPEIESSVVQPDIDFKAFDTSKAEAIPIFEEEHLTEHEQPLSILLDQNEVKDGQPKACKNAQSIEYSISDGLRIRQEQQNAQTIVSNDDASTEKNSKCAGHLPTMQATKPSSGLHSEAPNVMYNQGMHVSRREHEELDSEANALSTSEDHFFTEFDPISFHVSSEPNQEEYFLQQDEVHNDYKWHSTIPDEGPIELEINAAPFHSPEGQSLTIWKTPPAQDTTLTIWKPTKEPDKYHESNPASADDDTVVQFGDEVSFMKSSSRASTGKGSSNGSTWSMSDLESHDDNHSYRAPGGNDMLIHIYFKAWTIATIILLLINCANMNWVYLFKNESWWMICLSLLFFGIQSILQWSVLELPLMSLASALVKSEADRVADGSHLTILINYNLLASYKSEVDATLVNAFSAYIGNLSPTVASVLVSATGDEKLKEYELLVRDNLREQIFEMVITEGRAWANGKVHDEGRARRVFEPFRDPQTGQIDENFVQLILPSLAIKYAKDFMVIQRITRVLRKCGQYQDLMLLSEGDNSAWTYTDKEYYKEAAREYGEPLFQITEDVENIQGRRFDYTLVLDSDTGVVKNSVETLLSVAAANPERAILQPAIKIVAKDDQSLFMHIDKMRQEINEPITAALTTLLGRSGFYGKGLIQNKYYIKALLGTRENPIEKVPIDVLSHDTFEAGALSPLYVSCVQLLEEPCGNYVTWDIRECRWNRGELLLAHYFFPRSLGRLFEWMMCRVRKTPPTKLILRHETQLDDAGAYIAHSALRQMMLKPLLLMYIVCRVWVKIYFFFNWLPLVLMVVLVLIIPKIPLTNRRNWHNILADILCCVLQYSPEPITGTIRVFKSARAHICGISGWVPQFKVEQDFLIRPAVVATFAYQWRLFLLTCASLTPIIIFRPEDYLLIFLFGVTAFIPIYTTITALPYLSWKRAFRRIQFHICCKCIRKSRERRKQQMLSTQRKHRREPSLPVFDSSSHDRSNASQLSHLSRGNREDLSSLCSDNVSYYDNQSYASRSSGWSKNTSQRNQQTHDHSHSSGSVSEYSRNTRRYQRTNQQYA